MNSKHPLTPSKAWHVTTPLEKYKSSEIIRLKGMERKACLSCLRSNPDVILRRIIRDTLIITTLHTALVKMTRVCLVILNNLITIFFSIAMMLMTRVSSRRLC